MYISNVGQCVELLHITFTAESGAKKFHRELRKLAKVLLFFKNVGKRVAAQPEEGCGWSNIEQIVKGIATLKRDLEKLRKLKRRQVIN